MRNFEACNVQVEVYNDNLIQADIQFLKLQCTIASTLGTTKISHQTATFYVD